ncbi:MAG: polysaccharide biosynthesis/export family protein [Pseudomonadales bacterium]|nr:polysaccharide biosynthesis/export family protein [Pseudomonadales bacterium]
MTPKKLAPRFLVVFALSLLSGCATPPDWLPSSGPSRKQVEQPVQRADSLVRLIDVDDAVARRLLESAQQQRFSQLLASSGARGYAVGPGDVLEVSIWEAPPAALFGAAAVDPRMGMTSTRASALPEQMVAADGSINVPFAGAVPVAGKSPQQIEREISRRLAGKANQPQVMVRVIRNATSNVTVVGEVAQSVRMPLTAMGERLLDAIAAAGGVRQPVNKVTVQLTRGSTVYAMPLARVIESPQENVPLRAGDVVTVHFQPLSFTVLGATGKNEEINFEAQGISLAQALARAGGMQDARADARGVFLFRFEDPALFADGQTGPRTPDGRVPVVYRLDMKNPASFLVAQNFPVHNRDVMYVANAPGAELQKFLNMLTSVVFTATSLGNLGN